MMQHVAQGILARTHEFRRDVLRGLQAPQKQVPSKYFYDAQGAQLFDKICELEEYYPTRTELSIMHRSGADMASRLGERCLLAEFGSGSGLKTRYLLEQLTEPAAYVPIDISRKQLWQTAEALDKRFPDLEVLPVCADFTGPFELPRTSVSVDRTVVYFPGSTIGNFEPTEALRLLERIVETCGRGGALLIGVDLKKDRATLERAYNDSSGVTAAFNLNLLHRMNRELGANFQVDRFHHHAFYNESKGRIEMHLVSEAAQVVEIDDVKIAFERGESICTEYSHKYAIDEFHALAKSVGLEAEAVWTDDKNWFAVMLLRVY